MLDEKPGAMRGNMAAREPTRQVGRVAAPVRGDGARPFPRRAGARPAFAVEVVELTESASSSLGSVAIRGMGGVSDGRASRGGMAIA